MNIPIASVYLRIMFRFQKLALAGIFLFANMVMADCGPVLAGAINEPVRSGYIANFLVLVENLLDAKILSVDQLKRWTQDQELPLIEVPTSPFGLVFQSTEQQLAYELTEQHLSQLADRRVLLKELRQLVKRRQASQREVKEVQKQTQLPFTMPKFGRLGPVKFSFVNRMPFKVVTDRVQLTHTIEAMVTPVTQRLWYEIMHFQPSSNRDKTQRDELLPDHPVETITWWSMLVFANELSRLSGLPEVYDFSRITWAAGTTAEQGTLRPVGIAPLSFHVPNNENIYEAKGYRLPTQIEQIYMLTNGTGEPIRLEPPTYGSSSPYSSFPVGTTRSIKLRGTRFYDLLDNVIELTSDGYGRPQVYKNPYCRPDSREAQVIYRKFATNYGETATIDCQQVDANERSAKIGFRLVRTLR